MSFWGCLLFCTLTLLLPACTDSDEDLSDEDEETTVVEVALEEKYKDRLWPGISSIDTKQSMIRIKWEPFEIDGKLPVPELNLLTKMHFPGESKSIIGQNKYDMDYLAKRRQVVGYQIYFGEPMEHYVLGAAANAKEAIIRFDENDQPLVAGKKYTVGVKAKNALGEETVLEKVLTVIASSEGVYNGFEFAGIKDAKSEEHARVKITWDAAKWVSESDLPNQEPSGYRIYSGARFEKLEASVDPTKTEFILADQTPGLEISVAVKVLDQEGNEDSNAKIITQRVLDLEPPAFEGVFQAAYNAELKAIMLNWNPPLEKVAVYTIYWGHTIEEIDWNTANSEIRGKNSATIEILSPELTGKARIGDEWRYYFAVRASDSSDNMDTNIFTKFVDIPDIREPIFDGITEATVVRGKLEIKAAPAIGGTDHYQLFVVRGSGEFKWGQPEAKYKILAEGETLPKGYEPITVDKVTKNLTMFYPNLEEGVDFSFVLRAVDADGKSSINETATPVKADDLTAPDFQNVDRIELVEMPASDVIKVYSETSLKLFWNPSPDQYSGTKDVVEYRVYKAGEDGMITSDADKPLTVVKVTPADKTNPALMSTIVEGLEPDANHCFVVSAVDTADNYSASFEIPNQRACKNTPDQTPPKFTGVLTATQEAGSSGSYSIKVNWPGGNADVAQYYVYISNESIKSKPATYFYDPDSTQTVNYTSVASDQTSITITNITDATENATDPKKLFMEGQTYYIMVKARDANWNFDRNKAIFPLTMVDKTPPEFSPDIPMSHSMCAAAQTDITNNCLTLPCSFTLSWPLPDASSPDDPNKVGGIDHFIIYQLQGIEGADVAKVGKTVGTIHPSIYWETNIKGLNNQQIQVTQEGKISFLVHAIDAAGNEALGGAPCPLNFPDLSAPVWEDSAGNPTPNDSGINYSVGLNPVGIVLNWRTAVDSSGSDVVYTLYKASSTTVVSAMEFDISKINPCTEANSSDPAVLGTNTCYFPNLINITSYKDTFVQVNSAYRYLVRARDVKDNNDTNTKSAVISLDDVFPALIKMWVIEPIQQGGINYLVHYWHVEDIPVSNDAITVTLCYSDTENMAPCNTAPDHIITWDAASGPDKNKRHRNAVGGAKNGTISDLATYTAGGADNSWAYEYFSTLGKDCDGGGNECTYDYFTDPSTYPLAIKLSDLKIGNPSKYIDTGTAIATNGKVYFRLDIDDGQGNVKSAISYPVIFDQQISMGIVDQQISKLTYDFWIDKYEASIKSGATLASTVKDQSKFDPVTMLKAQQDANVLVDDWQNANKVYAQSNYQAFPARLISFDFAKFSCEARGAGYHLTSPKEWYEAAKGTNSYLNYKASSFSEADLTMFLSNCIQDDNDPTCDRNPLLDALRGSNEAANRFECVTDGIASKWTGDGIKSQTIDDHIRGGGATIPDDNGTNSYHLNQITVSGSRLEGTKCVSSSGIYDMIGNVAEFVDVEAVFAPKSGGLFFIAGINPISRLADDSNYLSQLNLDPNHTSLPSGTYTSQNFWFNPWFALPDIKDWATLDAAPSGYQKIQITSTNPNKIKFPKDLTAAKRFVGIKDSSYATINWVGNVASGKLQDFYPETISFENASDTQSESIGFRCAYVSVDHPDFKPRGTTNSDADIATRALEMDPVDRCDATKVPIGPVINNQPPMILGFSSSSTGTLEFSIADDLSKIEDLEIFIYRNDSSSLTSPDPTTLTAGLTNNFYSNFSTLRANPKTSHKVKDLIADKVITYIDSNDPKLGLTVTDTAASANTPTIYKLFVRDESCVTAEKEILTGFVGNTSYDMVPIKSASKYNAATGSQSFWIDRFENDRDTAMTATNYYEAYNLCAQRNNDKSNMPPPQDDYEFRLANLDEWSKAAAETPSVPGMGINGIPLARNIGPNVQKLQYCYVNDDPNATLYSKKAHTSNDTRFCSSYYGARNMFGNVAEWVDNQVTFKEYAPSLMGSLGAGTNSTSYTAYFNAWNVGDGSTPTGYVFYLADSTSNLKGSFNALGVYSSLTAILGGDKVPDAVYGLPTVNATGTTDRIQDIKWQHLIFDNLLPFQTAREISNVNSVQWPYNQIYSVNAHYGNATAGGNGYAHLGTLSLQAGGAASMGRAQGSTYKNTNRLRTLNWTPNSFWGLSPLAKNNVFDHILKVGTYGDSSTAPSVIDSGVQANDPADSTSAIKIRDLSGYRCVWAPIKPSPTWSIVSVASESSPATPADASVLLSIQIAPDNQEVQTLEFNSKKPSTSILTSQIKIDFQLYPSGANPVPDDCKDGIGAVTQESASNPYLFKVTLGGGACDFDLDHPYGIVTVSLTGANANTTTSHKVYVSKQRIKANATLSGKLTGGLTEADFDMVFIPKAISNLPYDYYIDRYEAHKMTAGVFLGSDQDTAIDYNPGLDIAGSKKDSPVWTNLTFDEARNACARRTRFIMSLKTDADKVFVKADGTTAGLTIGDTAAADFLFTLASNQEWYAAGLGVEANGADNFLSASPVSPQSFRLNGANTWSGQIQNTGGRGNLLKDPTPLPDTISAVSKFGVWNMGGNAREWVDLYTYLVRSTGKINLNRVQKIETFTWGSTDNTGDITFTSGDAYPTGINWIPQNHGQGNYYWSIGDYLPGSQTGAHRDRSYSQGQPVMDIFSLYWLPTAKAIGGISDFSGALANTERYTNGTFWTTIIDPTDGGPYEFNRHILSEPQYYDYDGNYFILPGMADGNSWYAGIRGGSYFDHDYYKSGDTDPKRYPALRDWGTDPRRPLYGIHSLDLSHPANYKDDATGFRCILIKKSDITSRYPTGTVR